MNPLRIHYLQHVIFENPGYILDWAVKKSRHLSSTRFYESLDLPCLRDFDWLIVMGGPMGVNDETKFPWLKEEKAFIKSAIEEGKTVIGICLGAQLIAAALGARVYRASKKEIGWHTVFLTREGKQHRIFEGFPVSLPVFHWHGDTFALPENSVHLMESIACKNQAFLYKENVLGMQFHLEATADTLTALVKNCRNELTRGEYIQDVGTIMRNCKKTEETNKWLSDILNRIGN